MLTFSVTHEEPDVVLVVDGEVDVSNAGELRRRLGELVDSTDGDIVVDCQNLMFLDSTGLGALLAAWTALRPRERVLRLRNVHGPVKRVVLESGIDTVLEVEPE